MPPPISTIILPVGSSIGNPAPIAAAIGSVMMYTFFAPACIQDWRTARSSTEVVPAGTQTNAKGLEEKKPVPSALLKKYFIIAIVVSKSAIYPSRNGRIATILPGVRPIMLLASLPTAKTLFFTSFWIATTDGSRMTIPLPLTKTKLLAVPKSIAISFAIYVTSNQNFYSKFQINSL